MQPEAAGVPDVAEHIVPEQGASAGVELEPGALPDSLHVQRTDALDDVVLDQRMVRTGTGDAAGPAVGDRVPPDDVAAGPGLAGRRRRQELTGHHCAHLPPGTVPCSW